jgi:hypothetical protein
LTKNWLSDARKDATPRGSYARWDLAFTE